MGEVDIKLKTPIYVFNDKAPSDSQKSVLLTET